MKGLAALFILVLFLTNISALCKDGQVDINSASAEELDKIAQIGPARAEQMITLRPFSSVDDMIRIDGIGENNINLIKSQGLACVDEETEITEEDNEENSSNDNIQEVAVKSLPSQTELESINLNPKAIKSEENSQFSGKGDYAFYGLIGFGVLLGLLFLIKKLVRKKYKNEFT
ncbi:MAG: helix-hairpin-helix domain-containing protein [Nanoarchaeota archaeon]|nr:helix-hairpin-helix domain-containing protein [Nanoarchaeota archaeon]